MFDSLTKAAIRSECSNKLIGYIRTNNSIRLSYNANVPFGNWHTKYPTSIIRDGSMDFRNGGSKVESRRHKKFLGGMGTCASGKF